MADPPARGTAPDAATPRRKVLSSAIWATGQQVVLLGANAVMGILLARTLSVEEFGIFSYAVSLASIGTAIVAGGLSGLAIKALLDDPDRQPRTMSSLIMIREAFALAAFLLLFGVAIVTGGSGEARLASALALLVLFARAWDAVEFWYQANLASRRSATIRIVVVSLMLGVRIAALALGGSMLLFVGLYAIEAALMSGALVARYLRESSSPKFGKPEPRAAIGLLSQSWILMLSGAASQINLKADQVILQSLLGGAAVGTYAAAARLSELTYFLPVVFMTATFPVLLATRKQHGGDSAEYKNMLQNSYDRACWVGIGVAATLVIVGPWLIETLYGQKYADAASILQIHVLPLPFVFMAAVFSKWILSEHLLWASFVRHAMAAGLNVGLNFLLIPLWGLEGAAVATVVSYTVGSYLSCFVGKRTRVAGVQMTLALVWPVRLAISRVPARSRL
jgi:O-antigen/teichoic acid export membrane protein